MAKSTGEADFAPLLEAVESRKRLLLDYLTQARFERRFRPAHIREAVYSYIKSGGKSLRPAVALLACGALGGDESQALPVAAAIEVYHTWTLVHDDVIDRDDTRRGRATVHREFATRAAREFGWRAADAEHYGTTIAMLAGDVQQAWAWSLLFEAHLERGLSAEVALRLAQELASEVTPLLVEGEALDVQYAGRACQLSEAQILDMLWKKTGALYEFAGRAGAAVGLNAAAPDIPEVQAMARFGSLCGIAFQIQDDILGIVGDAGQLGKPVGSDIREGKTTLLTLKALELADDGGRRRIQRALGDASLPADEVAALAAIFRESGVIRQARELSRRYVREALTHLETLPDNRCRRLLALWAQYLVEREF